MATQIREYLRVIQAFSITTTTKNAHSAAKKNIDEVITHSREFLLKNSTDNQDEDQKKTVPALAHAIISSDATLGAYVPLCSWNTSYKAWNLHFPTSASGLRPEHKIHAAYALMQCNQLHIPVAQILLQSLVLDEQYNHSNNVEYTWQAQDMHTVVEKYIPELTKHLSELIALTESENANNEHAWKHCDRRYCDVCKLEQNYTQDDVRTLRKSKNVIEDLLQCGITRIQDIPPSLELHSSARRQVTAVHENKRLFFDKEIQSFLDRLPYPRYYLDFESISTSVPLFGGIKAGGFVPFLFSLQWQTHHKDGIHTQLWGMPPATDKRIAMWQQLKTLLKDAQSIIVYSRNFEDEMISQLSQFAGEVHIGQRIKKKIVDLQEIFFYLSAYDPKQKGKISLKTLASVWLHSDYSMYKVQDGMEANYFFTALSDEKHKSFEALQAYTYTATLSKSLHAFDAKRAISLQDIAQYCKYDTVVMIRLVSLLEDTIER